MQDKKMLPYLFFNKHIKIQCALIMLSIGLEILPAAQNVYGKYACDISFSNELVNSFE